MEKILAENVKRLCKQQGKQLKDLASDMDIDASSLTRVMYGNARLDTIEKMAVALGVSVKSLFEPMGDEAVEGFIKIRGKIYQFNTRVEFQNLLNNLIAYTNLLFLIKHLSILSSYLSKLSNSLLQLN